MTKLGYFLYDFIDIIINKKIIKFWEVLIHHIAVGGMFFYNVIQCQCIAYNVVALLAEINTIFLHTRKLLQMCRVKYTHWLYRANSYVNLVTFIIFRFGALIAIAYGLYEWGHRVTATYFVLLSSSCLIMTVINTVLFWRLLKNDMLRKPTPSGVMSTLDGKQKTH
ncbi:hypothetical protein NP493_577g02032 [Ridgeia piscesae]|uniref:TLC domain-containing protein n=1 Tax=Ridgeia piscesae TaxID=27915 RepID=A0AAD9KUZ5_RIDPI|nr:hypothetical protein NP493_577g02032 [Ridgeia piscesae]